MTANSVSWQTTSVSFYADTDNDNTPDQFLDCDYGPYSWDTYINISWVGSRTIYAQAYDSQNMEYSDWVSTTVTGVNRAPTIGSFSASPSLVVPGTSVTLTASNVSDSDNGGSITSVSFYRDNTLLHTNYPVDGWSYETSTSGLSTGTYTYYAVATDNDGGTGGADVTAQVRVGAKPTVSGVGVSPTTVDQGDTVSLSCSPRRLGWTSYLCSILCGLQLQWHCRSGR